MPLFGRYFFNLSDEIPRLLAAATIRGDPIFSAGESHSAEWATLKFVFVFTMFTLRGLFILLPLRQKLNETINFDRGAEPLARVV